MQDLEPPKITTTATVGMSLRHSSFVSLLKPVSHNKTSTFPFHVRLTVDSPASSNCLPGYVSSSPRRIEGGRGRRQQREDCFSAPVDSFLGDDFDFEKNLALFDKKAVFEEIESNELQQQDFSSGQQKRVAKYKHDENVLRSAPTVYRQIQVNGDSSASKSYVTDTGLQVPTISYQMRCKLFELAESNGLVKERQLEMIGRSASEMVMQLLGGVNRCKAKTNKQNFTLYSNAISDCLNFRFTPSNAHQRPLVAVVCGPHLQGAQGVNCARHLACHNADVTVFVPNFVKVIDLLEVELKLFALSRGTTTSNIKGIVDSIHEIHKPQ